MSLKLMSFYWHDVLMFLVFKKKTTQQCKTHFLKLFKRHLMQNMLDFFSVTKYH